ncbi:hypothetical protein Hanom_Chr14g01288271 [Helianthus anomalus]
MTKIIIQHDNNMNQISIDDEPCSLDPWEKIINGRDSFIRRLTRSLEFFAFARVDD